MFKKLKKTMLIAEACENHFGKLSNAKKMIREAKKSGADYVKFQHHIPEEEMLKKVPKSKNFNISLYNFLKKNSLKIIVRLLELNIYVPLFVSKPHMS